MALSGGKDSTVALYMLRKLGYDVEALMIDLETGEHFAKNRANAAEFCDGLGVPFHCITLHDEFKMKMPEIWQKVKSREKMSNCMVCGVIKKWMLNKTAKRLGFTKIATGHNLDDAAETIMMNLFSGNPCLGINEGPMTGVIRDNAFVQRIKPLYFISNDDVRKYAEKKGFRIMYEPCPFLERGSRVGVRGHLAELEKIDPKIKGKIVNNFMESLPALREKCGYSAGVRLCGNCGEPARGALCKRCALLEGVN